MERFELGVKDDEEMGFREKGESLRGRESVKFVQMRGESTSRPYIVPW